MARNGAAVVDTVRPAVRKRDPKAACVSHARLPPVALADLADCSGSIEMCVYADNISHPPRVRLPVRFEAVDWLTFDRAQHLVEKLCWDARRERRF